MGARSITKKEVCEMCTKHSENVKCENKDTCKLLNLIDENKELKKENSELRCKMSYMINPNAIGNRNDMGW